MTCLKLMLLLGNPQSLSLCLHSLNQLTSKAVSAFPNDKMTIQSHNSSQNPWSLKASTAKACEKRFFSIKVVGPPGLYFPGLSSPFPLGCQSHQTVKLSSHRWDAVTTYVRDKRHTPSWPRLLATHTWVSVTLFTKRIALPGYFCFIHMSVCVTPRLSFYF